MVSVLTGSPASSWEPITGQSILKKPCGSSVYSTCQVAFNIRVQTIFGSLLASLIPPPPHCLVKNCYSWLRIIVRKIKFHLFLPKGGNRIRKSTANSICWKPPPCPSLSLAFLCVLLWVSFINRVPFLWESHMIPSLLLASSQVANLRPLGQV